jgi:hypothetical protein
MEDHQLKLYWIGFCFDTDVTKEMPSEVEELHQRIVDAIVFPPSTREPTRSVLTEGGDGFSAEWHKVDRQPPLDVLIDIYDRWSERVGFGITAEEQDILRERLEEGMALLRELLKFEPAQEIALWEWETDYQQIGKPPRKIA